MKRFDGNSILWVDADYVYAKNFEKILKGDGAQVFYVKTIESAFTKLKTHDFDIIVCNYSGEGDDFYKLVDWCKYNLEIPPVFVALSGLEKVDKLFLHHYQIAEVISKKDELNLNLKKLYYLLFDFDKFYQSMLDISEPRGIFFNLLIDHSYSELKVNEVFEDGALLAVGRPVGLGSKALLRVLVHDSGKVESYLFSGFIEENFEEECLFKVYPIYLSSWGKFLSVLNEKQTRINNILNKVSGL